MCQINWVKTFDRFDWEFFFSALQKFIHMIKVVFTKIKSKIKINCLVSDPVILMRGVRQAVTYSGCSENRYTGLGAQTLAHKKHFSSFLFQFYFNKSYVEGAIIDFTMQLIMFN